MWLGDCAEGFTLTLRDYKWEMILVSIFGWIVREIILPVVFNPIRSACKYLFLMMLKAFIPNGGNTEDLKRQLAQGWAAFVRNPKQETFELIDYLKASTVAFFVFVVQKFWPGDSTLDLADTDSEAEQDAAFAPTKEIGSSSSNSPFIAPAGIKTREVKRTVLPPHLTTATAAQSNAPFYTRYWRHIYYNWKSGDWRTKVIYLLFLYYILSFCILFIVEIIGSRAIVNNIDTTWETCETDKKRERDLNKTPITDEDIRRLCGDQYEDSYIAAVRNSGILHCLWVAFWNFPILNKILRVFVRTISQMTEQDGLVLGVILPFIVLPIVIYKLACMVLLPAAAPVKRKKVC